MPRPRTNFQKPKNAKKTLGRIFGYMLHRKWMLLLVLFTVAVSSGAGVVGNYLLKPVINEGIIPLIGAANPDFGPLIRLLCTMGAVYLCGAACTFGTNRMMMLVSTGTLNEIRKDLFEHLQDLPIRYFDTRTHGETMSRFTNDVDTCLLYTS